MSHLDDVESLLILYWNKIRRELIHCHSPHVILQISLENYLHSLEKERMIEGWNVDKLHARWIDKNVEKSYLEASVIVSYWYGKESIKKIFLISPEILCQKRSRWLQIMEEIERK